MKKFLILLMMLCGIKASAYNFEADGLCYSINSDSVSVSIDCPTSTAFSGELVIPSRVAYDGKVYTVNSIKSGAFASCTGITGKLTIPSTITYIGSRVFVGCSGITSLDMEASYSLVSAGNIATGVFSGCTGIKSVFWNSPIYAKSVSNFNNDWRDIFSGCTGIEIIEFGNNVDSIQSRFCAGASNLKTLKIPKSVKFIDSGNVAANVESIIINQNNPVFDSRDDCNAIIETATNTLLYGCKTTIIPNSITSIGGSAFKDCTSLTTVTIPNSVTSIGIYAFSGCSGLTSVTIPNSVTSISGYAFKDCTSLTSVTIPNSVTSIGIYAFFGCSGLTSVTIPNSVTSISGYAFKDCGAIKNLTWNAINCSSNGNMTTTNIEQVTIGDEVKKLPGYFVRGSKITSVTIPNSVIAIGSASFSGCNSLNEVNISDLTAWCKISFGDSLANPLAKAHSLILNGEKIDKIVIPNSLNSIGNYAFYGCKDINELTIPNSINSIGSHAFAGCELIADINSEISNPTTRTTASNAFEGVPYTTCKLHIPAETKHMYQVTTPWNNFENIIEGEGKYPCDVNGDGVVDIYDVNAVINRMLGKNNLTNADVNGDGMVDIFDVNEVINFMLGKATGPGTTTYTVNGVSFKMVAVEGGTFTMGATAEQGSDAYDNEKPAHQVSLSSYSIGQTEVTQELWQAVMGINPSQFTGDLQRPVERVSWDDCQTFINKLNQMTGMMFRLPTEAEWEYAARGGNRSQGYKYAGSNTLGDVAWYESNSGHATHPVAAKSPNELGIYDMSGNVHEWCQDWYGSYSSDAQTDPTGPASGSTRVLRGGDWSCRYARLCRVSRRSGNFAPSYTSYGYLGLRLAL